MQSTGSAPTLSLVAWESQLPRGSSVRSTLGAETSSRRGKIGSWSQAVPIRGKRSSQTTIMWTRGGSKASRVHNSILCRIVVLWRGSAWRFPCRGDWDSGHVSRASRAESVVDSSQLRKSQRDTDACSRPNGSRIGQNGVRDPPLVNMSSLQTRDSSQRVKLQDTHETRLTKPRLL